jgi:hypothetical protein
MPDLEEGLGLRELLSRDSRCRRHRPKSQVRGHQREDFRSPRLHCWDLYGQSLVVCRIDGQNLLYARATVLPKAISNGSAL